MRRALFAFVLGSSQVGLVASVLLDREWAAFWFAIAIVGAAYIIGVESRP